MNDILNNTNKNKPKKMDVSSNLHIKITTLQSKLYNVYGKKIRIQDITNKSIKYGLENAEKILISEIQEKNKQRRYKYGKLFKSKLC